MLGVRVIHMVVTRGPQQLSIHFRLGFQINVVLQDKFKNFVVLFGLFCSKTENNNMATIVTFGLISIC
jgi:hypothetical protein